MNRSVFGGVVLQIALDVAICNTLQPLEADSPMRRNQHIDACWKRRWGQMPL